ncbi:oxidoreductase [Streptomyces sp. SID3212]|uniref:oxidoreductase n=1 Tax=unclassified Streptomyces TaxID=2593676 RepID=UPI00136E16E5|nr:oxidoreductase [Streptomyces sp. SID3212]MYV56162.1 SDR family oxidoreductase [Streptomyces sp. SID3212]
MYIPTPTLPEEFAGRRVLITGGSRGVGAAAARRLLDAGAVVVTSARGRTDDTPEDSTFIAADLRTADGARGLVEKALETLGGLDVLVNSAGASRVHFGEIPDEEWEDSLAVNFLSAVRVTTPALAALKEAERASVINLTTGITANPPAPLLHYGAAKAALESWSKGLATQLAPAGVRVNLVSLGMVDTPGGSEILQTVAGAMGGSAEQAYAQVPLGRGGDSRDIAELIAFLASDRAQWIAGANITANGGA